VSWLAGFPQSDLCPDGDEAGVLDQVDELVQPAHEERLAVGGREAYLPLLETVLRGSLEDDHEQGAPRLLEQAAERRGRKLEPYVCGMVQHLYHGATPSVTSIFSPAANLLPICDTRARAVANTGHPPARERGA
jgi:hypothetical protein